MPYSNLTVYIALALYALVMLSIPFRLKKHGKAGLKGKDRSFWVREIIIFAGSPVLILLCLFIHFELLPTIVLCGCGVLAAFAASQELFPKEENNS